MTSFVRWWGLGVLFFALGCSSSLPSSTTPAHDAGPTCAGSGESCAASGCCGVLSDSCLPQGNDMVCVNAIPPQSDAGGYCLEYATSDLLGATLTFDAAPCSYSQAELAAGIQIPYHVEIDPAVEGLHPVPTDAGGCQQPDAAGLIIGYQISGGGQSYCLCDTGLCPSQTFTTATTVGTFYYQIPWDGRNWYGPSDTGNPEGAPFPIGTYTVTLTATGSIDGLPEPVAGGVPFTLTATRTITITP